MPVANARASKWTVAAWWSAALAAAACVWFSTSLYGPGLDGDGAYTVSAARNLIAGNGLVTLLGEPYTLWPPLYPILIALADLVGFDAYQFVRVLHAASLAGIVVMTASLVWRATESAWLSVTQAVLLASSVHLLRRFVALESEPFFTLLCALALYAAVRFADTERRRWWWITTALAAAACLQRYLGVALVIALALFLLAHPRTASVRARVLRAGALAFACAVPLVAWLLRNYAIEQQWTGGRTPTHQGLFAVLGDTAATLRWFSLPWPLYEQLSIAAWSLVAVAFIAVLLWARSTRLRGVRHLEFDACLAFASVYVVVLVALSSRWLIDRVGARFLIPVLPFASVAALIGGRAALQSLAVHWPRLAVPGWVLAGVFVAAIAATNAHESRVMLRFYRFDGTGSFHSRFWMEQPLCDWLRENRVDGPFRSNAPEMVWRLTDAPARMLRQNQNLQRKLAEQVSQSGTPCTVLWFRKDGKPVLWIDEIAALARVEVIWEHPQAVVLRVEPR